MFCGIFFAVIILGYAIWYNFFKQIKDKVLILMFEFVGNDKKFVGEKTGQVMRDEKLANVGWRIMRFKENAIEEHPDAVQDMIYKNIVEAAKQLKKKSAENENISKYGSTYEFENGDEKKLGMNILELPNGLGKLILIGTT